jgi:hypothetical protein
VLSFSAATAAITENLDEFFRSALDGHKFFREIPGDFPIAGDRSTKFTSALAWGGAEMWTRKAVFRLQADGGGRDFFSVRP